MKKCNNRIIKRFIVFVVVTACAFGLVIGIVTANSNTEKQLRNVNNEKISEKELVSFFNNAFSNITD